jgi:hypothetical protein
VTRPLPVLLGLTVAAPLLLGLGGCSSDPYETYCERVEEHQAALGEAVAAGGPDALLDVLAELRDLRDAAPSDIADEWQQVVGRLEALQRALDDAGRTAIDAAARELVRPETAQSMASVETQARDVCQTPLYL